MNPIVRRYDQQHLAQIALPLGGIGTGTVSLGGRGDLRDWEIVNRPAKGFNPGSAFFAIRVKPSNGLPVTRALQGLGGAMVMSTGVAILTAAYPPSDRGRVLGINVSSTYLGLSLGPVLGGFLTQNLGWRSIFWCSVPVAALAFAGYRLFMFLLPLWGFFFGLALGAQSIQALFGDAFLATVTSWVVGFVVALIFAVLSYAFYLFAVAVVAGSLCPLTNPLLCK